MKAKTKYIIITLICLFSFCYNVKAEDTSKWNGKCVYGDEGYIVYFNQNEVYCKSPESGRNGFGYEAKCEIEADELLRIGERFCPEYIYIKTTGPWSSGEWGDAVYYVHFSLAKEALSEQKSRMKYEYYNGYGKTEKPPAPNPEPIESCKDLFGEDFLKKLNKYLNIVKIAVPIILIGYGVLDFSKAMFSGTDDMKKAQKNFLLRILAAILFFLLPIFVNLVLTLGNKVWSNINPDICIK